MSRPDFTLSQLIVTAAPIGIVFGNRDGIIELSNPAAEAVFGYNSEEAAGQSLDLIIPKHLREAHWRGYRAAMASGQTKYSGQMLATRSSHEKVENLGQYVNWNSLSSVRYLDDNAFSFHLGRSNQPERGRRVFSRLGNCLLGIQKYQAFLLAQ